MPVIKVGMKLDFEKYKQETGIQGEWEQMRIHKKDILKQ